ncbi:fimbrial biogenesis outer membrane usher protein [Klebsiella sp. RHBSTW-00215]|uniref:fimbria/pilus outer membrane usher protein n=1 Tax=Klebsiella sp. RHBSTW-00215 TaxID=2742640 RepID=UPI0015F4E8AD|nr:fimbria/pilus outer membrane usher protein [Klebsiella sp. RHBSTW-00215]MBA7931401.1 fimbrial biogenesis outer membrane usher protein [Klebsiella sp. RHBSTW-00215]
MIMVCQDRNILPSFNDIECNNTFVLKSSYIAILCCLGTIPLPTVAGEYFNPHLLEVNETGATAVDLSYISQETVPPGKYNLDVYLNDKFITSESIVFKPQNEGDDSSVQPCISVAQLKEWSIKTEDYPELTVAGSGCAKLSAIPGWETAVQLSHQRVDFTLPQVAMLHRPQGYVPESRWQQGITAGLFNYNLSGQKTDPRHGGESTSSQFVSLQPGLNVGPWRLRNYSTLNHNNDGNQWDSVYSYISRDIHALKGQMIMGQTYTSSGVFDSISFTGLQLNSDKEMLPDCMNGFAPVIKGIARTTADVTVYQNGYSIYKTTVSPGAFEINDLYPTGSAGDLYVTVKESDGSEQSFVVPFASLAILQREGQVDYSFSSGKTRSGSSGGKEYNFLQSTVAWGALSNVTLYSGFQQLEDKYSNLLLGAGFNLGSVGALSFDASQSVADIKEKPASDKTSSSEGQSYRVRFSKDFPLTGTNFSVAGYRYSTHGYYSLQNFIDNANSYSGCCSSTGRTKDRFDASASQVFSGYGSLSLSLVSESYWDNSRMESLGVSYSNTFGRVSYFINYSYNRNVQSTSQNSDSSPSSDNIISLTVSVPFGADMSANYNMNSSRKGDTTHSLGLNGAALTDRSLNWNVQEGYNANDRSTSGNVNLNYQGSKGEVAAGYGYDSYSSHYNYSLRGGMVAHSGGVTFSRYLGESVALVEAPGVSDVAVRGQTNVMTDSAGYAVVPFVRPYHENNLSLDEQQVSGAEIDNIVRTVVPTRSAIVKVKYDTWIGYKAMMTLRFQNKEVPFGAIVSLNDEEQDVKDSRSTIVGDAGQVYLTGLPVKGILLVKWGDKNNAQCRFNYDLSGSKSTDDIVFYQANCR